MSTCAIFNELIGVTELIYNLIKLKPSIIHVVSTKGIIYGGILGRLLSIKSLVISYAGMGYLFTGKINSKMKLFRKAHPQKHHCGKFRKKIGQINFEFNNSNFRFNFSALVLQGQCNKMIKL